MHLYKNLLNVPHAAERTRKLRLCWGRWVRFSHSSAKEDHAASTALKSKKLLRALQSQRNATQRNATLGILSVYRIVYCQISHCNSEKRLETFYWDLNYYQFKILESNYCNAILYRVVEKNCVFTGTSYIQCDIFSFSFFFFRSQRTRSSDR